MRKRAGMARALVLDPEIILCDEPDSGLDPVRTAFLNQTFIDLNDKFGATFLIVTHDINTARSVPDNIGLLYRRHLAMFGPRLELLASPEPVVRQFLNGRKEGPIGMAEEKDAATVAAEQAASGGRLPGLPPIQPQLLTSDGRARLIQRVPTPALVASLGNHFEVSDTFWPQARQMADQLGLTIPGLTDRDPETITVGRVDVEAAAHAAAAAKPAAAVTTPAARCHEARRRGRGRQRQGPQGSPARRRRSGGRAGVGRARRTRPGQDPSDPSG